MEEENIILDIEPKTFGYRFIVIFFPTFLIFFCIIFCEEYFCGGNHNIGWIVLVSIMFFLGIRGVRWSKNYITKISIIDNKVKINLLKYNKNVVLNFELNEIRAVVSLSVPKGGRSQLFISQRVKRESILQYEMGEWTRDKMEIVAEVLMGNATK